MERGLSFHELGQVRIQSRREEVERWFIFREFGFGRIHLRGWRVVLSFDLLRDWAEKNSISRGGDGLRWTAFRQSCDLGGEGESCYLWVG